MKTVDGADAMKSTRYADFKVKLWEPDGAEHDWEVKFVPLHPRMRDKNGRAVTRYGECVWGKRVILINSMLRSPDKVWLTLCHETHHATLGPNASEWCIQSLEWNFERALRQLRRKD